MVEVFKPEIQQRSEQRRQELISKGFKEEKVNQKTGTPEQIRQRTTNTDSISRREPKPKEKIDTGDIKVPENMKGGGTEIVDAETNKPLNLAPVQGRPGINMVPSPSPIAGNTQLGTSTYVTPEREKEIRQERYQAAIEREGGEAVRQLEEGVRKAAGMQAQPGTALEEAAKAGKEGGVKGFAKAYGSISQRARVEATVGAVTAIPGIPATITALGMRPVETVSGFARQAARDPVSFTAQAAGASVVFAKMPSPKVKVSKPTYRVTQFRGIEDTARVATVAKKTKTGVEVTRQATQATKKLENTYTTKARVEPEPYKLVTKGSVSSRAEFSRPGVRFKLEEVKTFTAPERIEKASTTIKRTPPKKRDTIGEIYGKREQTKPTKPTNKISMSTEGRAAAKVVKKEPKLAASEKPVIKSVEDVTPKIKSTQSLTPAQRARIQQKVKGKQTTEQKPKLEVKSKVDELTDTSVTPKITTIPTLGFKPALKQKVKLKTKTKTPTDTARPTPATNRVYIPKAPTKLIAQRRSTNRLSSKPKKGSIIRGKPAEKLRKLGGRYQATRSGLSDAVLARTTKGKKTKSAGFFRIGKRRPKVKFI